MAVKKLQDMAVKSFKKLRTPNLLDMAVMIFMSYRTLLLMVQTQK